MWILHNVKQASLPTRRCAGMPSDILNKPVVAPPSNGRRLDPKVDPKDRCNRLEERFNFITQGIAG